MGVKVATLILVALFLLLGTACPNDNEFKLAAVTTTTTQATTTTTSTTTTVPATTTRAVEKAHPSRTRREPRLAGTPTDTQLDLLADCESGRTASKNTGNGYFGAFQFALSTWERLGQRGNPVDYSYDHQRSVARLINLSAWPGQFPGCYRKLHQRGVV